MRRKFRGLAAIGAGMRMATNFREPPGVSPEMYPGPLKGAPLRLEAMTVQPPVSESLDSTWYPMSLRAGLRGSVI
jgi:hypothetical protein